MKILCFILSMPKNNSWNNKWTGEKNLFARTKRITENKEKKLEMLGIDFKKKEFFVNKTKVITADKKKIDIRQLKLFKTYRENRVWEGE